MEIITQNTYTWNFNVKLHDNGVLSIGTVFRIFAPCLIESIMVDDITLITMIFPVVIMQLEIYYTQVFINYQVQGDNDSRFVLNGVTETLNGFNPISTSCSGIFCDHQSVDD